MAELPRVFGDYLLLKSLGAGTTGDVYLARPLDPHAPLPAPLVIKRMHAELAEEEKYVRRFRHEARIAVAIDSPYVAKVYDIGRAGGVLYIAMQLIEGWPLSRVLQDLVPRDVQLSLRTVTALISDVLQGLRVLHEACDEKGENVGFVHRDISPKNIIVGRDGASRLIDLGLGKSRLQDWKTKTGMMLGTPGYMSREQVNAENVDARTDLFAVGVILFELLTFEPFIRPGSLRDMLHQAIVPPPFRKPSLFRAELPASFDQLVERAVANRREDRFQSAAEFLDALAKIAPPADALREPMDSLIGEMLWAELDKTNGEIAQLLSLDVPQFTTLQDDAGTEVIARRVRPDSTAVRLVTHDTLIVAKKPATATITLPRLAMLLIVALTLLVGIGVGRWGSSREETTVELDLPIDEKPRAQPRPLVAEEKQEIEEKVEQKPAPRTIITKRKAAPVEAIKNNSPVQLSSGERLERMLDRATAIAKAAPAGSPARAQAQSLITDLSRESLQPDAARIATLEARLRAIDRK